VHVISLTAPWQAGPVPADVIPFMPVQSLLLVVARPLYRTRLGGYELAPQLIPVWAVALACPTGGSVSVCAASARRAAIERRARPLT
jgi:hypothetical protein